MSKHTILIIVFVLTFSGIYIFKLGESEPVPEAILISALRDPTYSEARWFLNQDNISDNKYVKGEYVCTEFALDTVFRAEKYGFRCYIVYIHDVDCVKGHAIIGFNTKDRGMVYFEPQDDKVVRPRKIDVC